MATTTTITRDQLVAHKKWLIGAAGGTRLVLRDAVLRGADLRNAFLTDAVLRGADLRGAVLRNADLCGADLCGADLRNADLCGADLCGADLRDAVLRGADLRGAVLRGADLRGAVGFPVAADAAERLQAVARAALEPNALEMNAWHTCKTAHCVAGWAVHLAGEPGRLLEAAAGTEIAGLYLLGAEAHRYFFKSNEEAREFLRGVLENT